jgi:hypothetical protein
MSTYGIPDAQRSALIAALGARLGFDPQEAADLRIETDGSGTAKIEWTEVRVMPEAEFVEMFNTAAVAARGAS